MLFDNAKLMGVNVLLYTPKGDYGREVNVKYAVSLFRVLKLDEAYRYLLRL